MTDNFGLLIEPLKDEDHVLGASGPLFPPINPKADWTSWLPAPETQNHGQFEPNACVSFATTNVIETLIRFTFGNERNFSDRFLAKVSKTDEKGGNSPQAVAQAWRDNGCANEIDWPFDSTVTTLATYYAALTRAIKTLALGTNAEYELRYKYVPLTLPAIREALKSSPLTFSTYAWVRLSDGTYYKPEGMDDNHEVMLYKLDDLFRIFDSYDQEGTVLKGIQLDSLPQACYAYQVSRKIVNEVSWTQFLINLITSVYGLLRGTR